MSSKSTWWLVSKAIAQVTLADRGKRRHFMSWLLAVIIAIFALGLWGLDEWLSQGLWRFLFYWGGCVLLCLFMFLMAAFDALAVIGEEKKKMGMDKPADPLDKDSDLR